MKAAHIIHTVKYLLQKEMITHPVQFMEEQKWWQGQKLASFLQNFFQEITYCQKGKTK